MKLDNLDVENEEEVDTTENNLDSDENGPYEDINTSNNEQLTSKSRMIKWSKTKGYKALKGNKFGSNCLDHQW